MIKEIVECYDMFDRYRSRLSEQTHNTVITTLCVPIPLSNRARQNESRFHIFITAHISVCP